MADPDPVECLADAAKMDVFFHKGKHCDLRAVVRSKTLLVTFDNLASIDERPQTGPWKPWLADRAAALEFSVLGVQSHAKDWYRTSEPALQISDLEAAGFFERFDQVLFVGASMGGFAALCFAGLVPGARVLAFSPQSTLNREITPFERRYPWPYRRFDWKKPAFLDAADYTSGIHAGYIFYDPHIAEDKQHAARLVTPTVRPVEIPFADHTLVRTVVKSGAMDHLLKHVAAGGAPDAAFWALMRNRRADKQWAKQLLRHVAARGDGPLARRACTYLWRTQAYPFARRIRRQLKEDTRLERDALQARRRDTPFWTDGLSEADVRRQIPVFINSYNQLTYLRDTVDWFARHGFERITVLDNQSRFPKLLGYFQSRDFADKARLVALPENMGPRRSLAHAACDPVTDRGFIFTDPDLTLPAPPAPDMIKTMIEMGLRHDFVKVGLALSIDPAVVDLDRVTYNTRTVQQVEAKYWKDEVAPGVCKATTDTTFFVYVPRGGVPRPFNEYGQRQPKIPSVRLGRKGFVALHRPWLFDDPIDPDEQAYYYDVTDAHSTFVMAQKAAQTPQRLAKK